MDFGRLLRETETPAPTEPRELYLSRPKRARGYGYLRDVQGQVLEKWYGRRASTDLVVKVNTGAGKTIDGLVILQSYLNAGEGPALYVAPSRYLVRQVQDEARKIDIPVVDDPDSAKYRNSEAIGVVNVWKLFNGKSVFRDTRYPRQPVPIGSVVIDDAHAALAEVRRALSIQLPASNPAFNQLLDLFMDDLRDQSPNALLDVVEKSYGALARVPFWAWRTKLERARTILYGERNSAELSYSWPAVSEVLELCRVVFSADAVSIAPLCNPVGLISGFRNAKHRIYLTATLADDSVLVTDFAADPTSIADPITPATAGDIGERMILAPLELNPGLAEDAVRVGIARLAARYNVVVIVPSRRIAATWSTYTPNIVYADDVSAMVRRLRDGHVGLVVLVNKYDGIDLPEDACRVLVLDGLPEAFNPDERVDANLVSRIAGTDNRQVQRIEQGMGRGIRSNEDHCVVFLLGPRLAQLVSDPRTFERFGQATQAQLKLSRQVARELEGAPLERIIETAEQVLRRDATWVELAKSVLKAIPPSAGNVSHTAKARRTAFDLAVAGDPSNAVRVISAAVAESDDEREQGWLLELEAYYADRNDPEQAQRILQSGRQRHASVLRPIGGIAYRRLSASKAQAQAASDFLSDMYSNPTALQLGFHAILDGLIFDPDTTPEFEQAFADLGPHLGFPSQRPEQERGEGPDVLWALGDLQYWVIEAKSGATTPFISKHDSDQLGGSIRWFHRRYDTSVSATPIMIHPSVNLGSGATAATGQRVITPDGLDGLKDSLRQYAGALAASRWDDSGTVARLLGGHRLRRSDLAGYMRAPRPR